MSPVRPYFYLKKTLLKYKHGRALNRMSRHGGRSGGGQHCTYFSLLKLILLSLTQHAWWGHWWAGLGTPAALHCLPLLFEFSLGHRVLGDMMIW